MESVKTIPLELVPNTWANVQDRLGYKLPTPGTQFAIPLLHVGDAEKLVLMANIPWECELNGEPYSGVVPVGFMTDLASIPRLISPAFSADGPWTRAALVHDDLYATERFERSVCDQIFRELLEQDGVGEATRWAFYTAVKVGGGAVWMRHTKESVAQARALHTYPANPFFQPVPS